MDDQEQNKLMGYCVPMIFIQCIMIIFITNGISPYKNIKMMDSSENNNSSSYRNLFSEHSHYQSQELDYTPTYNNQKHHEDLFNQYSNLNDSQNKQFAADLTKTVSDTKERTKPKLAQMRNLILREGKDEDLAREPRVLTSVNKKPLIDSHVKKNSQRQKTEHAKSETSQKIYQIVKQKVQSRELSPQKSVDNTPQRGVDKKVPMKEEFYKYCTEQIVRVTNKNTQLQKKLQQTKNSFQYESKISQDLKQENGRLKIENQFIKRTSQQREVQIQHLRGRLAEEEKFKLEKIKQEIQNIGKDRKHEESEIARYVRMLSEKDEQNNRLVEDVRSIRLQNLKLVGLTDQNARLNRKIAQLITRSQNLQKKVFSKSEAVDHLWRVKEVEYGNVIGLIKRAEGEFS